MQIHIAALTQKALGYDEFTRRAIEQEKITQQASETGVTTEERSCPSRKSYPRVAMMQSEQNWCGNNRS